MRVVPLYNLKQGINRLRVKGGVPPTQLYDLVNAFIQVDGSIKPREGTIRAETLDGTTKGLMADDGIFNVFSNTFVDVPAGYTDNVLVNPNDATQAIETIWFAKPFMGFPYVVAEFANGDVFHYWLQDSGIWAPNTVYFNGTLILPTTPTGFAYDANRVSAVNPLWQPETAISLGTIIEPTEYTGFQYEAVAISGLQQGILLHFDGISGQVTFPDSGGYNITVTPVGAAQVETSSVQFGTGALSLDGTTSYLTAPAVTGGPIDIGLGDFTVEFWAKPSSGAVAIPFSMGDHTLVNSYMSIGIGAAGASTVGFNIAGSSGGAGTTTLDTTSFHHIAACVQGSTAYLFVDGVQTPGHSPFAITTSRSALANAQLVIGAEIVTAGPDSFFGGDIDEFRITKGTALYTANFTPPTAPFTVSAVAIGAHTGETEPSWPTVAGGTIQEFGDFDTSSTDAGTTQGTTPSTAQPLSTNITDRYGDSSDIANAGNSAGGTLVLPTTASTNVTTWAPGTLYAPGAVVQPSTGQGAFVNAIPNGDFEDGDDGAWVLSSGTTFNNTNEYQGNECLQFTASHSDQTATMASFGTVSPGQSVTATAYVNPNNAGANLSMGINLRWYDATDTFLSATTGPREENGGYRLTSVSGIAPSNAAHVRVQIDAGNNTSSHTGFADLVSWNLATAAAVSNFLFEAVQAAAGVSASTEPVWPTTDGTTVIDNTVTWKAIGTSIITWEAIPIMQSGTTEPTWPTAVPIAVHDTSSFTDQNGNVIDTSISWVTDSRQITDPKCPNTIGVALGASHVFAIDKDIVDFSAAVDPTDWSSANNAGYLPTGLNNYGDNPAAMLALYRSNLMAFNAGGYQMWQIDPDPANMALLDAQPIGSTYARAAQSVSNNLLFLTEVGVRDLGTVGATANMAVGSSGQPVDPLILPQLNGPAPVQINMTAGSPVSGTSGFSTGDMAAFGPAKTKYGQAIPAFYMGMPVAAIAWKFGAGNTSTMTMALQYIGTPPSDSIISGLNFTGDSAAFALGATGLTTSLVTGTSGKLYKLWTWTGVAVLPNQTNPFTVGSVYAIQPKIAFTLYAPISLYYPGRGQYWLMFGPQAFVFTVNGQGLKTWSRYLFPDTITDWTLNGGVLYLRSAGNLVWQLDANTLVDDAGGENVVFDGVIQWPYLDQGALGINKGLIGIDLVGVGQVTIQIGWRQDDPSTFNDNPGFANSRNVTPPFTINFGDTVPGEPLPFPANSPSYTLILNFPGNQSWSWQAANMYVQDMSGGGATG